MTDRDLMVLAKKLKALLSSHGLSLSELARRSGLSKGYVSQLTTGKASNPSVDAVGRIAAAFGVKTGELLGDDVPAGPAPDTLPEGLRAFAATAEQAGTPLPSQDLQMLQGISYRGRHPTTEEEWRFLYDTIRLVLR